MSHNQKMRWTSSAKVYVAEPGTPRPEFNDIPSSGWTPIGTTSWGPSKSELESYKNAVDRLVSVFDQATSTGAIPFLVMEGAGIRFRSGDGRKLRRTLINDYLPERVDSAIEAVTSRLVRHEATLDGVSAPLLEGAL